MRAPEVNRSCLLISLVPCLGALFVLAGMIYSLFILDAWFLGQTSFEYWVPLMIVALIMGGFLIIALGIIGNYVRRIHDKLKEARLFGVDERVKSPKVERSLRVVKNVE